MLTRHILMSGKVGEGPLSSAERSAAEFFLALTRTGAALLGVSLVGAALLQPSQFWITGPFAAGAVVMTYLLNVLLRTVLGRAKLRDLAVRAAEQASGYAVGIGLMGLVAAGMSVATNDPFSLLAFAAALTATSVSRLDHIVAGTYADTDHRKP